VRKVTGYLLIALVAAGCRDATATPTPPPAQGVYLRESPTPYTGVTAGDVHALIPDRWKPRLAGPDGGFERGFIASPSLGERWGSLGEGRVGEGMAAVWIDGTEVGVPSDYYYLAATGAAVDRLTDTSGCNAVKPTIFADHRPSFADGPRNSPGDYVALGEGVCSPAHRPKRFVYFVAAPGYGPVHRIGIPASGLYVVVAVVADSPRAESVLDKLVFATRFGSASVGDLIRAAKTARPA
jgi:hypothetical protein